MSVYQKDLFSLDALGSMDGLETTLERRIELLDFEAEMHPAGEFVVSYSFYPSLFGELLIASTSKGICFAGFSDDRGHVLAELKKYLPGAKYFEEKKEIHEQVLLSFGREAPNISEVALHVKGTEFQLKVWKQLLKIPFGQQTTYKKIALALGDPNASRAVGAAVGDNPVAFWIPCHRVLHSTGKVGHFHWGSERKRALLNWEMGLISEEG